MQTIQHDPTKAPDKSKTYCLMNSDGTVADWFATHDDAVKAMRSTSSASRAYSEGDVSGFALSPVEGFEFTEGDGVWIEALQAKKYHHPQHGEIDVSPVKLQNLVKSVKNNVRGIQLSTDYEHGTDSAKGKKASGTVRDAKVDGDKLFLNVAFTDVAKQEIKAGEWKYFSSDFADVYTHEDGTKHFDVLLGGGLTNRPVAKSLSPLPINFSEFYNEVEMADISAKDRNNLPDSDFLYIESGGKKDSSGKTAPRSLRHLPVPDETHLDNAISRLSQKETGTVAGESWLTDSLRSSLLAKARAMKSKKMSEDDSMSELLKQLAEQFGIEFSEGNEDEVQTKLFAELTKLKDGNTKLLAEVKPLRELKATTETAKSFAEQYPEQAKQMEEDKKFRSENNSRAFAENIGTKRFSEAVGKKDAEGNDVVVTTTKGLSAKALETIRETHLKFSEGEATVEDFNKTLSAVMENGIVDYGESGTSQRGSDGVVGEDVTPDGTLLQRRQAFAEKVREVQTENSKDGKEMQFSEALTLAAQKYPKMYDAYLGSGSVSV